MSLTVTLLGDLYAESSASAAQGFQTATNGIGSSVVPAVSGVLAGTTSRYPFLIYLLFVPVLAIAFRYLPEPTRNGGQHTARCWTSVDTSVVCDVRSPRDGLQRTASTLCKLVTAVDEAAGDYAFTTGGGVHTSFPRRLPIDDLNGTFMTANFAGMSQEFPPAMGAQLALDKPVFAFEGDGGFTMVMQDLETAVREDIPAKVVVLNNESFMSQSARQKRYYGGRYTGSVFSNPNFATVAEEFGMFGEQVTDDKQITSAVDRLLSVDSPGLLDVHIDPWLGTEKYNRD